MIRFLSLVAVLCSLTTLVWADENVVVAANEAIDRNDRAEAVRLLAPAADAGNANAQALLGSILLRGAPDVPRDDQRAAYWMQRAANQGFAQAQLNLGAMYKRGAGVPGNAVQAHFWMSLGLTRLTPPTPTPGDLEAAATLFALDSARYERDQLASYMTVDELAESERLQRAWTPRIEIDGH
jgi:hypothetical protein